MSRAQVGKAKLAEKRTLHGVNENFEVSFNTA
jgi:hypothetical protein